MADFVEHLDNMAARAVVRQGGGIADCIASALSAGMPQPSQDQLRSHAIALIEAGKLEQAAVLWGCLLHLNPGHANFVIRILRCMSDISDPLRFMPCFPDGFLTWEIWRDAHVGFGTLIRRRWNAQYDGRHAMMKIVVREKAADIEMRMILLKCLGPEENVTLMENWLQDGATPADLIELANLFELAGMPQAAHLAFSEFAKTNDLNFHTALLGARIAVQIGDSDMIGRCRLVCRAEARTQQQVADRSAVYHLLFLDAEDGPPFETSVHVLANALSEGALQVGFLWRYIEQARDGTQSLALLDGILGRIEKPQLKRQLWILCNVVRGDADAASLMKTIVEGIWDDPDISKRIVRQALKQVAQPDTFLSLMSGVDLADPAIRQTLREQATDWRAVGRLDLAAQGWAALLHDLPQDDWARINAIFCFQSGGDLSAARRLAEAWQIEEKSGTVAIHIGFSLARLGMSDKARTLLQKADSEFRAAPPRPAHRDTLARGLMLYGDMAAAQAYLPDRPARTGLPPSAVVLDPGHTDTAGHHANYNVFFSDFISEHTGVRPEILINVRQKGAVLEGHDIYSAAYFEPYSYNGFSLGPTELEGLNTSFRSELEVLFKDQVPHTLVIHSMRAVMLKGFVAWLKDLGDQRPRKLIIGLIEADHLADADLSDMYTNALRQPLSDLGVQGIANLILFAETTFAVRWLQEHSTGITVHKFPYLAAGRAAVAAHSPAAAKARQPVFGILGATRRERGFNHIFQAILDPVARDQPWLVQVDDKAIAQFGDDTQALFHQVQATAPKRAEFIHGFLSEEVYYEAFSRQGCLVLPYSGRYAVSGSGVLYEAIYGRKYLIVSDGSTLATELVQLGYPHTTIDLKRPESLGAAVAQTAARWPEIVDEIEAFFNGDRKLPLERFTDLFLWNR